MQKLLRFFARVFPKHSRSQRPLSTTTKMSSSGTAASLYAATVSPVTISGATPEDARDKSHHLKDGKGFTNPWVNTPC